MIMIPNILYLMENKIWHIRYSH